MTEEAYTQKVWRAAQVRVQVCLRRYQLAAQDLERAREMELEAATEYWDAKAEGIKEEVVIK